MLSILQQTNTKREPKKIKQSNSKQQREIDLEENFGRNEKTSDIVQIKLRLKI